MSLFSPIDIQEVRRGLFRMRWDIDDVTTGPQKETVTLCGSQLHRSYIISFYPRQLAMCYRSRKSKDNWPVYIRLSVKATALDRSSTEPLLPEYVWIARENHDDILLHETEPGIWRLAKLSSKKKRLTINLWMDFGTKTQGEKKIMNGLADLFVNQSHCDVQFRLKDELTTVGAHVAILSAGSPVFAAMFQTECLESRTRKVVINDIQMNVFWQLLTYLYTGNAPDLENEEITQLLFEAADKYGVTTLKNECVDVILHQLTVSNVISLLVWANFHSIHLLYEAAMTFIAVNGRHLCFRPDWVKLMTDYPGLCLSATQRIVNQLSSNNSEDTEMDSE